MTEYSRAELARGRRLCMTQRDDDLLLTLAWAGPLLTEQVQRIAAPMITERAVRQRLNRWAEAGLVEWVWYYRDDDGAKIQQRVGKIWSLSDRGYDALAESSKAPRRRAPRTRSLLEHDLMLSELVTLVVERTRSALSGIYLRREVRLDDSQTRPKCDAILVVRLSAELAPATGVPWQAEPPTPEEQAVRAWAVEIDRDTEGIAIIRDKALNYASVWQDSEFYARYGRMPVPLWVVPTQRRLENVQRAWATTWPEGKWLIATDAGMRADRWTEWYAGQTRARSLIEG